MKNKGGGKQNKMLMIQKQGKKTHTLSPDKNTLIAGHGMWARGNSGIRPFDSGVLFPSVLRKNFGHLLGGDK